MGTVVEKLQKSLENKASIKQSLSNKRGKDVGDNQSTWASEIDAIEPLLDTLDITENNVYDVKDYKKVNVGVYSEDMQSIFDYYNGTSPYLVIPYGLTKMTNNKLSINLDTIYIPNSVVDFQYNSLYRVTSVYYKGTFEEWLNKSSSQFAPDSKNWIGAGLKDKDDSNKNMNLYIYENDTYRQATSSDINFNGRNELNHYALSNLNLGNFSLTIPKTITKVGAFAFSYLKTLNELIFESGENFVELSPYSFYGTTFNTTNSKLVLPKTIDIPYACCIEVNANEIIVQEGTKTLDYLSFYSSKCKKVTLPTTLETIGDSAFSSSTVTDLVIPANVTSIGKSALKSVITIYFRSTTPPTITTSSLSTNSSYKYYVPKGYSETYKTATNWSKYASNIYEEYAITLNVPTELLNNESVTYSTDGGNTYQQFTNEVLLLSEVGIVRIKSTNASQTILIGTSAGGNDVGTISNSELTFSFTTDTNVYLTIQ